MKAYQKTFGDVLGAVNQWVRANGGPPDDASALLKQVVDELGMSTMKWRVSLGKTRANSPETFAMLYRALGVDPPPAPPKRERPAEEEETAEEEAQPEETSEADALYQVLSWLAKLTEVGRRRVMAAVRAFHAEGGDDAEGDCPGRVGRLGDRLAELLGGRHVLVAHGGDATEQPGRRGRG